MMLSDVEFLQELEAELSELSRIAEELVCPDCALDGCCVRDQSCISQIVALKIHDLNRKMETRRL